ncbi:MAG: DUF2306 domain-containing protein [Pseudomonadota bacterium]
MHTLAAVFALLAGVFLLALKKGTRLHRATGYVWVAALGFVALSSFWIHDLRLIGPFSPIHLLSIWALYNLVRAVWAARAGNIATHSASMKSLYLYALIGAGLFTLLPGRILHQVVFG